MNHIAEKKNILLIEDSVEQTLILKKLLESHDYTIDIAYCAKEGLIKSKKIPDLILLDRTLPDLDGLEVCQYIKEDKKLKYIPIIFLTGRDTIDDIVDGLYIGADDYITKPFSNKEVLARILAVLRRTAFCEKACQDRDVITKEMDELLRKQKIASFFQPIFSLSPHCPMGLEAFSRPSINSIFNNPTTLFDASIKLGTYQELENICWKKAVTKWKVSGCEGKLFLNCLTPFITENAMDITFFDEIGIHPKDVVVEITNFRSIKDQNPLIKKICDIKSHGASFSIDNFGDGFCSIDPILELKPQYIKIKLEMFRHITSHSFKNIILKTTINKCKKYSIKTIAEGIEDNEELKYVKELNFDGGQGNLLGLPRQNLQMN